MPGLSDDEHEILSVIHAHRIAIWMQDFEAYQKCFAHEAYTTRWNASPVAGIHVRQGWEDIAEKVQRMFADSSYAGHSSHANAYDTEVIDLRIRIGGDMAWATYRQRYPAVAAPAGALPTRAWHHAGPSPSHEVRFFERHGGRWLIVFLGYLDPDTTRSSSALLRLAPDGTVEWQNEPAIALLAADDDLVVRNGRLRVRDKRTDERLQSAIKWAAALSAPLVPSRGSIPIVMQAGEGLPAKVWRIIAESGQILFSFGDTDNGERRLEAAAVVYGLSSAQKQVAGHIIDGKTLGEIAQLMGITANTARTHLDRVFQKAGVRNQSALVRVMLSAGAPI